MLPFATTAPQARDAERPCESRICLLMHWWLLSPKRSHCEATRMNFLRRWCHCRKQSWKSFSEIVPSRCVGCQECQQIFVPSGHSFNFAKSQESRGGGDTWIRSMVHFEMGFLARHARTFIASCAGFCHGGESACQAAVRVFSSEHVSVTLAALSSAFLAAHFLALNKCEVSFTPWQLGPHTHWMGG
jgi:hypothetical protein